MTLAEFITHHDGGVLASALIGVAAAWIAANLFA